MIRSIFTRDGHAASYDMAVPEAIIAMELKFGEEVPTGSYLDMAANLPLVDPKKVLAPVLMIRGIHDGNSTTEDLMDFFQQLPNGDRQFVILPYTAHSPGYSNNRHLLWYATRNFLAAPAAVATGWCAPSAEPKSPGDYPGLFATARSIPIPIVRAISSRSHRSDN